VTLRARLCGLSLLALAACTAPVVTPPAVTPAPPRVVVPAPVPSVSAASEATRVYFAQVQAQLLSLGLLRTDGGGQDTPFTDRMLAENFVNVALFDEYAYGSGGPVQQQTSSSLRRWKSPVRISLQFGASVSPTLRATETARVGSYLARLQMLTGHPISLVNTNANFTVAMVNEDERRAMGPQINRDMAVLTPPQVDWITNLSRSNYCFVYALSDEGSSEYTRAFAVVRAELPDLLRLSCFHEEIAQGLGLANDSRSARPSIFNDDEEFALLTAQDEYMLRMLYDPALQPGMTEAQARPIVETLATRLLGGDT
jgi:Protein of unknown function (DUF2927)